MSKHTPGPFEFKRGVGVDPRDFIVVEPSGNTVAETNSALYSDASEFDPAVHQITIEEAIANSHLFAAAPDMLSALKAAEPLMTALCSVALKPEIDDYLPSGLKEQITAWLRANLDGKAIRKAEAE